MGRMFRIITEGNLDYPTAGTTAHETESYVNGSVPYIEVGGPVPVMHAIPNPKPLPRVVTTVEPMRPAPVPTMPTRQILDDRYLSVALHQIAPKSVPAPATSPVHPDIVAYHHSTHAVSAEYRGLRDEFRRQVGTDTASKAVLFTSAASDNGTTTVLLNLAVTLANETPTRVLVIDADFDRPSAARKMGLSDVPGLSEVLAQTMPLAWVLQPTVVPKLQILGAGRPTESTVAAMATDFPRVVAQLRQWFDWILIDGGVWGERPHRDSTSPAYDGIYLITRHAELDRPAFNNLRSQVAKHGGLLRGFITTTR